MNPTFIHLRTHSSYSLAESTLKINNLVELARLNHMPAIALTDNNNMFGVLEFSIECLQKGIQPIIGSSVNLLDFNDKNVPSRINFLVKNEKGYKKLLYLYSLSHTSNNHPVGIYAKDLEKNHEGLICYIGGEYNPLLLLKFQNKISLIEETINFFQKLFGADFLFEIQRVNDLKIDQFENNLIQYANDYKIPLIGSNNVKFQNSNDFNAHDALLCIAQKSTINQSNRSVSNPELHFKSSQQMKDIFNDIPVIIENNLLIAMKCNYFPREIEPKLPKFINNSNISESELLENIKIKDEQGKSYSIT